MDAPYGDEALHALSLATDVRAIGEALLTGDLMEARFRTAEIARSAHAVGHVAVAVAALHLADCLSQPLAPPSPGIGAAYVALATSVEAALGHGDLD